MTEDILKSAKDIQRQAAESCHVSIPLSLLQDLIAEIDKWTNIAIANHQERADAPKGGPKLVPKDGT
jgi:hypothetical protein